MQPPVPVKENKNHERLETALYDFNIFLLNNCKEKLKENLPQNIKAFIASPSFNLVTVGLLSGFYMGSLCTYFLTSYSK
jgi:hypothetical protein